MAQAELEAAWQAYEESITVEIEDWKQAALRAFREREEKTGPAFGHSDEVSEGGAKDWREDQHPRDHGQFSSAPGGTETKPSESADKPSAKEPEHPASALGKIAASAKDRLAVAGQIGHAAFVRLPKPVQTGLANSYAAGKWLGHYAETSYRIGRNVALEVAKERGADQASIDKTAKLIGNLDLILGWTVNFPVATAITGNPLLGKASSWAPVASMAYIAYSGARNPIKTVRAAARALVGRGTAQATGGHKDWSEQDHPRGNPKNPGQFSSGGGGATKKKPRSIAAKPRQPDEKAAPEKPITETVALERPKESAPVKLDYAQKNPGHAVAKEIASDKATREVMDKFVAATAEHHRALKAHAEASSREKELYKKQEELDPSSDEAFQMRGEWVDAFKQSEQLQKQIDGKEAEMRQHLLDALKTDDPIAVKAEYEPGFVQEDGYVLRDKFTPTPEQEETISRGLDFVRSIVSGGGEINTVVSKTRSRAFAKFNEGSTEINIGDGSGEDNYAATIVHEYGHAIEHQKPYVMAAMQRFRDYRCGDESLTDMEHLGLPGEMGRKDDFEKAFTGPLAEVSAYYVGREYKTGNTELLSMGLEQLYRDPVGFMNRDPEYAHMIIWALRTDSVAAADWVDRVHRGS